MASVDGYERIQKNETMEQNSTLVNYVLDVPNPDFVVAWSHEISGSDNIPFPNSSLELLSLNFLGIYFQKGLPSGEFDRRCGGAN